MSKIWKEYWVSPADLRNDEVVCHSEDKTKNFPEHTFKHVIEIGALEEAKAEIKRLEAIKVPGRLEFQLRYAFEEINQLKAENKQLTADFIMLDAGNRALYGELKFKEDHQIPACHALIKEHEDTIKNLNEKLEAIKAEKK